MPETTPFVDIELLHTLVQFTSWVTYEMLLFLDFIVSILDFECMCRGTGSHARFLFCK